MYATTAEHVVIVLVSICSDSSVLYCSLLIR
jgi:hypothetical protein